MKIAVIVGAGLATRLKPITEIIPKVLINYGQHTILKHLIDLYNSNHVDKIILILPNKHKSIVESYLSYMNIDNIEIMCCDQPYGSGFAIKTIEHELIGHNVIFNWSDIIPDFGQHINWASDTVYTYGKDCRYNFTESDGIVNVGSTGGNVVGVYQTKAFMQLDDYMNLDFVDCYDFSNFKKHELNSLVDLGDFDKLKNEHKKIHSISRSFNKITFVDDKTVLKEALDKQGIDLQKIELSWYHYVAITKNNHIKIPAITYNNINNTIEMTRINGPTLANSKGDCNFELYVNTLLAEHISSDVIDRSYNDAYNDYRKEFYDKILDRCNSIDPLIKTRKITHVNGAKIFDLKLLLELAWVDIEKSIDTKYEIIHGDLNFSNVLIENDVLYMIDPRGYFGDSKIFGPKDYDISKILYALSGYDLFNSKSDWSGLTYEDNSSEIFIEIQPLLENWKSNNKFEYKHQVMVALIWVALAGYFKNNPYKALASYYYGLFLLSNLYRAKIRSYKDEHGEEFNHVNTRQAVIKMIITKFPEKWLLIDRETNVEYVMSTDDNDIGSQWVARIK